MSPGCSDDRFHLYVYRVYQPFLFRGAFTKQVVKCFSVFRDFPVALFYLAIPVAARYFLGFSSKILLWSLAT